MKLIKEDKNYIFNTYKRFEVSLVKGRGKYVWDENGKRYLDFFSGISVCNFGHCHPSIVKAIKKQAQQLIHVSNHYYTKPQVNLAKELIKRTFPGKVFFSNSGAEANECAIKLARKWAKIFFESENKFKIIVFKNSFHGRTIATLTATGQEKFHKGFEPLLEGFYYANFNDIESVKRFISENTAAIMIEPIQAEGGVYPAAKEFLASLRELCDKNKILLIFDEVQTGLGRTGEVFAYKNYGIQPDIITLGKSLGGGLPIGVTIAKQDIADVFTHGDHGSTFGGNLLPCSAALEVIKLLTPKVLKDTKKIGQYFTHSLMKLQNKYDFIKEVRGLGLMIGIELDFPCREIVEFCMNKGLLINCTQNTILRFLPPLIINKKDVDVVLEILEESFKWIKSTK